ncbi:hypothetical protein CVT24_000787 [Panaeolus cyanescens]|uniref:Ricin B lectin domain-containing protein n=1 Tax=Panaeolus cyanescens TaxID=181874 RepID=A0A409YCN0_9AGAR|nr:hypothetical protein CVT24_000787 [Panaeolus cyanescens]
MPNIQSNQAYYIRNVKGGTVIDQSGHDGSIIGYPQNGGANQQWIPIRVDDGWHIKNAQSGKYLALDSERPKNDDRLLAKDEPFVWHIWDEEAVSGSVRVCVPNCKKDVDLSDHGNPAPGTPISVWGRWEGQNQMWYFDQGKNKPLVLGVARY